MVSNPWAAWPAGTDPADLAVRLRHAHEAFLAGGRTTARVRPVVLESWRRSRRNGVDPLAPRIELPFGDADLAEHRRRHPLAAVLPVVRRLLVDGAEADGLVVALGDAQGRLLWVEGDRAVRRAVGAAGFVEGASWHEEHAGTSAPGIALATDHEVQVFAAEHFACAVQPWSCSAAPVHAPDGTLIGVLDVTGGDSAAAPHMLSLVRATVAAVESELAVRHLRAATSPAVPVGTTTARRGQRSRAATPSSDGRGAAGRSGPDGPPCLEVLGRSTGLLRETPGPEDGTASSADPGVRELSLRHTEILLLLAAHPEGLGGDALAVALHLRTLSDVTVRAEVSRLRRVVGDVVGPSRPYRLGRRLTTDAHRVRRHLDAGDVAAAVRAYPGPLLPRSEAPGVVGMRERLDAEVRAAVDATDDVEAVVAWAVGVGADDWSAWRRLTDLLPVGSPRAARAHARLRLLDRELG